MIEEWRKIPGFEYYKISNLGNVKLLDRVVQGRSRNGKPFMWFMKGRLLKQHYSREGGYLRVSITLDKSRPTCVHYLVCLAFNGPRPSEIHQVAHNDGNKSNCRSDNLRWATPKENTADKVIHGTQQIGEKASKVVLSESDVEKIKVIYSNRMGTKYVKRGTRQELALQFGVCVKTINDVVSKRSWKHL